MARKCFLVFCLVGVAALGLTTGDAQAQSDQERKQAQANQPVTITGPMTRAVEARPAAARPAPDGPGVTITYDDGIVTALPAINGYCFGNQFNTLDTLLSQLQTTSTFLTQQLASLPEAGSLLKNK